MDIIGIDLGTKTGYAVCNREGTIIHSEMIQFKKDKRNPGQRYRDYLNWLGTKIAVGDTIFYEDVKRHRGTLAAHVYGCFQGILEMVCYEKQVNLIGLGVGTIKKYATGTGNADKDLMIEAANDIVNDYITDDNEADAIHIALLGYNNLKGKK